MNATARIAPRYAFDFPPVRQRTTEAPVMVHRKNDDLIAQVLRIKAWSRDERVTALGATR